VKPLDVWKFLPLWQEVVFIAIAAGGGIWAWLRARQAQSWPSTQATIRQTTVRRAVDRRFKPLIGELSYTYVIDAEYYSGFHRIRARSERRAEELISGWKGRMVVVRYSPEKHAISVLLKTDQPGGQLGN
jgi:hypothetical protein